MTDRAPATWTPRSRPAIGLQRLLIRAGRTPLRPLILLAYRLLARAVAAYVIRGQRGGGAYAVGGLAKDDFVPGLSDVDMVFVVRKGGDAPGAANAVRRRAERLRRFVPLANAVLEWPSVYRDVELEELAGASAFTYGLDDPADTPRRAGYLGEGASLDRVRMLGRPGLYGTREWRLLSGSEARSTERHQGDQDRRLAAWLELLFWWRLFFASRAIPSSPRAADMAVKLVAEPARIWLWLAHGERPDGRADALRRALERLPQEERSLRRALDLHGVITDGSDRAIADLLPAGLRLSSRIAALIRDQIAPAGVCEVRLAGAEALDPTAPLPLGDWRSLACPERPDESFLLLPDDPGDVAAVTRAAHSSDSGPYPALRSGEVMILPGISLYQTLLRAIKCPVTDPVAFAVADGSRVAAFPNVDGWSARDTARRATAEHRAWLRTGWGSWSDPSLAAAGSELGMLLTAARAALFLEGLAAGEPELPVTVGEAARRLATRAESSRTVAEEALGSYRTFADSGEQPGPATVAAMRRLVSRLPAYA